MKTDLNILLSDHQVLYQKLRNYHWNVKGPLFFGLHQKFEEMYLAAAENVDALAERIVAIGGRPASTLAGQLELARLSEDPESPNANTMVANLVADLGQLTGWLRTAATRASEANDVATLNMLESMADSEEQTTWMLKAFLAE